MRFINDKGGRHWASVFDVGLRLGRTYGDAVHAILYRRGGVSPPERIVCLRNGSSKAPTPTVLVGEVDCAE